MKLITILVLLLWFSIIANIAQYSDYVSLQAACTNSGG
jgi:hypothetical protein